VKIITTLTGSYPPIQDASAEESIHRAVQDQIEAKIDLLVDGQIRSDIASLFFPIMVGGRDMPLPYPIERRIEIPTKPISLSDYQIAKKEAGGWPMKAHVTGPTFLAQSCEIKKEAPYKPYPDRSLVMDIAQALAQEVRFLRDEGQAEYIQIDEPSFAFGANLEIGLEAVALVAREAPKSILHVCGDVTDVFDHLLMAPVDILNMEGDVLRDLDVNEAKLKAYGKQIAYGCLAVNTDHPETIRRLKRDVAAAIEKLGEGLWGLTPNCGLRLSPYMLARERMRLLVEVARDAESRLG
jgi:5-methyltetrahydropteroyltriglutamate--homocysteine methyltransferase